MVGDLPERPPGRDPEVYRLAHLLYRAYLLYAPKEKDIYVPIANDPSGTRLEVESERLAEARRQIRNGLHAIGK